ncbi:Glyoxalase/bleomycin resistance protein/dioxygenase [Salinisphaera sp. PC39]|uniref:VOC family protein n=1 Tax=Salinisphaera sp. PC39 TaxID=1304156 RepID=UPI00333F006F
MAIECVSAVTLFVSDMARSCRFYRALGFELKFGGEHAAFTGFYAGTGYLNLARHRAPETGWGRAIFHVDDVDACHRRAIDNGLTPAFEPRDAEWGERYFHIRDPDGHELSFATPLPGGPY